MNFEKAGKRIKAARLSKSMSQDSLAEKAGVSANYIGMIERGEKVPSLQTFIGIINALEASADMILSDITVSGYRIKNSLLAEKINTLSENEQNLVFEVINTMINNFK